MSASTSLAILLKPVSDEEIKQAGKGQGKSGLRTNITSPRRMHKKTGLKSGKSKCQVCSKYSLRTSMTNHLRIHNKAKKVETQRKICGNNILRTSTVNHLKIYKKAGIVQCELCGKNILRKSMARHFGTHKKVKR